MISAAEPVLGDRDAMPPTDYRRTVASGLMAALIAFAEELEKLAADTREAARRGWKGKSEIYDAAAALLRGRAAELETHGPIDEAAKRRAEALAETERLAEQARTDPNARPTPDDIAALNEFVGERAGAPPQVTDSPTESSALQVGQSGVCGIRDEMGYECDRPPHEPGDGKHEVHRPDGSVSVSWPDVRSLQAEVVEFLKGDRDDLPDLGSAAVVDLGPAGADARELITAAIAANPSMGAPAAPEALTEALSVNPDPFSMPAALAADPFSAPDAASPAPWRLPPNPRPFAFDPSTAIGVPDHVSYSQIVTAGTCALQLRLKKRDGVVGQPAYWNVGGTAFHACVELVERRRLGLVSHGTIDRVLAGDLAACAELFSHNLDIELAEAEKASGLDRSQFRVAAQGAEGDTWWRHNGALMVQGYVAHSDRMRAEGWDILRIDGKMLGLELDLNTPIGYDRELGRPVNLNARLDVVWFRWEPAPSHSTTGVPTLHLHIEDGKSGAKPVTDTFQLGLYGRVLQRVVAAEFPPPVVEGLVISAAYYDARNCKSGEAFDPLAAHSWEEIEYRGLTTLALHASGIYPANPNSAYGGPCGLCDVRHACPIMAMKD